MVPVALFKNLWGLDGFEPGGEATGVNVSILTGEDLPLSFLGDGLGDYFGDCLNRLIVRLRRAHIDLVGVCWKVFIVIILNFAEPGPL